YASFYEVQCALQISPLAELVGTIQNVANLLLPPVGLNLFAKIFRDGIVRLESRKVAKQFRGALPIASDGLVSRIEEPMQELAAYISCPGRPIERFHQPFRP